MNSLEYVLFSLNILSASDLSLLQQVGAQVMLLKNLEMGTAGNGARMLVNGSRGVITNFLSKQASPILMEFGSHRLFNIRVF